MAFTVERTREAASPARAGNGIVVAPDRKRHIRKARRHSTLVRLLRLAMPVAALAILVYYLGAMLDVAGIGKGLAKLEVPRILPQDLTMNNPRYRGFNPDGSSYVVEAKAARQDLKAPSTVQLTTISGVLTRPDDTKTRLSARSGVYDTRTEFLTLLGGIRVTSDDGAWARLNVAQIEPKAGIIRSKQPVAVGNKAGTIRASSITIRQKTKEITFAGKVHATLQPAEGKTPAVTATSPTLERPDGSADAAGSSLGKVFSGGSGPIEVHSDRLDIDDVKKTATFIGNVRAIRGASTLTTPELRIAYDGAPSGGLAGGTSRPDKTATAGSGSTKIKTILATAPVVITEGEQTRVSGQTALFDAATETSTIDGGVVIARAPDTQISAPTATYDQRTHMSRLTGGVVIHRAPTTQITASMAEFNTETEIAVISGDVAIRSGADRSATGDRIELDSRNETAVLTGDVVLMQGKNVLKGTHLLSDQKAKLTELTAPSPDGGRAGRIAARFYQTDNAKGGRKSRSSPSDGGESGGGFTSVSSFRTDPTAPLDVAADKLTLDEAKSTAVFSGDVLADQGGFQIKAAELRAHYTGSAGVGNLTGTAGEASASAPSAEPPKPEPQEEARLSNIQARGKVIVSSSNGQKATGDWADFDIKSNTATVGGDVVLSQGRNVVRGNRLVVDMTTGESIITTDNSAAPKVSGEKPGSGWRAVSQPGRPSAVFFPQQLREAAQKKTSGGAAASSWAPVTSSGSKHGNSN